MKRRKLLVLSLIVLAGLAVASSPVVLQFLVLWGARAAAAFDRDDLASRTFESDGVRLRYIAEGSGHPVVLVHGFASSLEHNWHDTGVIDLLTRAGFQVIAYDARGHGRSDKPHDPTRYGAEDVRDIIRLLDHLGLERAHLVGYSRGAMLAHHAREWHPERLRTVTLGGYGSSGRGAGPIESLSAAAVADSLQAGSLGPLLRALTPGDASPPSARQVAIVNGLVGAVNDMRALAASFRSPPLELIPARSLRANSVPVLALVGEADPIRAEVALMAEVMSGLEVRVVPGADHVEAPAAKEFGAALVEFLRRHDRRPADPATPGRGVP